MEALWLKSHNYPHAEIAKVVGVTENTIRDYFEMYKAGGIEKLKEVTFYRPKSETGNLHGYTGGVFFRPTHPRRSRKHKSEIEALTGVRRSETQVREFLKKTQYALSQSRDDPRESRS